MLDRKDLGCARKLNARLAIFETENLGQKGRVVDTKLRANNQKDWDMMESSWEEERTHGRMAGKQSNHSNVNRYEKY